MKKPEVHHRAEVEHLLEQGRPIVRDVYRLPLEGCPVCDGFGTVHRFDEEVSCPIIHPPEPCFICGAMPGAGCTCTAQETP